MKGGYEDHEDALVKSMLSLDSDSDDESRSEQTLLTSEASVGMPDSPNKMSAFLQQVGQTSFNDRSVPCGAVVHTKLWHQLILDRELDCGVLVC